MSECRECRFSHHNDRLNADELDCRLNPVAVAVSVTWWCHQWAPRIVPLDLEEEVTDDVPEPEPLPPAPKTKTRHR